MKKVRLGNTDVLTSAIALGVMRISQKTAQEVETLLSTAVEQGIDLIDNADIYGGGRCEELVGEALKLNPALRDKLLIQSKCCIRQGYYDASKDYILQAVDGSLKRLGVEYLDVLLLHRPDALIEPQEVAEAFDTLYAQGKVKNFGVSNFNGAQIQLLKKFVKQPIVANQLQFGVAHTGMVDVGVTVNTTAPQSVSHDGQLLDYCRLNDITIQPWSPFWYANDKGRGAIFDAEPYGALNAEIDKLALEFGVSPAAIATAWIMRHPAGMQTIVGTTNPEHLKDVCTANKVELTREQWYTLYKAAGNIIP